jgi:sugar lactone lactonase YvrE
VGRLWREHLARAKGRGFLGIGFLLVLLAGLYALPRSIGAVPFSPSSPPEQAQILYTFDLRHAFEDEPPGRGIEGKSASERLRDYDLAVLVATLQGIVNRQGPRLYVYHATGVDDYWLETFRQPGEWLERYTLVPIPDLDALLRTFRDDLRGLVVWDDAVPATLNVATTAAGVEDAAVLRRGSELFDTVSRVLPVVLDLSGRFRTKEEAYRWAMEEYLKSGRANPLLLAYIEDGWPAVLLQQGKEPGGVATALARDYLVQHRAFVFDLSPWPDEAPVDEPDQPLGRDRAVLEDIFSEARGRAGDEMIALWGFVPWWDKYSNAGSSGGKHQPVEGEWEMAWLASSYGAYFTGVLGDVFGLDMANASLHSQAPFPSAFPRPAGPTPDELRARGLLEGDRVAAKTYLLYYMGDYDFAQPLYTLMPEFWEDARRGELPLAWGINPQHIEILPDILHYLLRTRSANDSFVAADSGAGYLNPEALPEALRPSWKKHNERYFRRTGLSITGFFLNGKGAEAPDEVVDLYRTFSADGITVNWHHLVGAWPRLQGNTPLTAFPHYGMSHEDSLEAWIEQVDRAYEQYREDHGNGGPVFLAFRCVFVSPSFLHDLTAELRRLHPERDYQVVDAYTFFYLMRHELGGTNEHRATFLRPMLPEVLTAGQTYAVGLPVRNDGWETWMEGKVGLGFRVAEAVVAGEPPGSSGEALFLPLQEEVRPGEVYTFTFLLGAPLRAGAYVVQYDLLEQPWHWFYEEGNPWQELRFQVERRVAGMALEPPTLPAWPTPAPVGPAAPASPTSAQESRQPGVPQSPLSPGPTLPVEQPAGLEAGWVMPPLLGEGLGGRAVWAVARDGQGRIWFGGTQGVGVLTLNDDLDPGDDAWAVYTEADGLPHPWVTAIAADTRGAVWFGTQGGGAARLDEHGWTVFTEKDGLASNWVRAIAVDAQGTIWFGTSRGVSAFSGSSWITFNSSNSPLPRDVVTSIAIDDAGNYWFATEGGGVSRLSALGNQWRTFTRADGLGDDFVLSLAVDPQGRIWAGTWRGGVSVYDGRTWTTYDAENSGLAANWVQSVAADAQGRIWCGTYGLPGGGVSVLQPASGQWVRYGPADGLPSDNVTVVVATRPGEVWLGTEQGALRYLDPLVLLGPKPRVTPTPRPPRGLKEEACRQSATYGAALGGGQPPETSLQPTATPTRLPSPTPTPTASPTPTPTSSPTPSPTRTTTPSPAPTRTTTPSPTATATATPTRTPTPGTATPTVTGTPPTATPTRTTPPTSTPCPTCPACPAPTPPPLPTKEENLEDIHTFTTSWGSVMRVDERPQDNALRVQDTRAVGGRVVRVYVNADTLIWVAGLQLDIRYDTSLLTAAGVDLTPRSAVMTRPGPVIDSAKGQISLLLFSPKGEAIPPGRGPIVSLLFEVHEGARDGRRAEIEITRAILTDVDGNRVQVPPAYIFDGHLIICEKCFLHDGDVDRDGEVTILDVQRGVNIVLGRHIADDEEIVALDVNGDGSADVLDVIQLVNLALGRTEPPFAGVTPTPVPTISPTPRTQAPTPTPTRGAPGPTATVRTPTPVTPYPQPTTPVTPQTPTPRPTATPYPGR